MLIKAHAKVNLALHVVAKREDDFHEIDTLMARISLFDEIWLEPQKKGITLKIINGNLPTDNKNLAYRAAELYLQTTGIKQGISITLKKQIPIAAGLGGGSSNAAAVLRGLKQLYPASINLLSLAEELGADVPFFVRNLSAARARGKGEKLETINLPKIPLILVNPHIAVSAKEAYENLQNFSPPLKLDKLLQNLKLGINLELFNALQTGVIKLYPEIGSVLKILQESDFGTVLMSGSGSTCFVLAKDAIQAKNAAKNLKISKPKWWIGVYMLT